MVVCRGHLVLCHGHRVSSHLHQAFCHDPVLVLCDHLDLFLDQQVVRHDRLELCQRLVVVSRDHLAVCHDHRVSLHLHQAFCHDPVLVLCDHLDLVELRYFGLVVFRSLLCLHLVQFLVVKFLVVSWCLFLFLWIFLSTGFVVFLKNVCLVLWMVQVIVMFSKQRFCAIQAVNLKYYSP